MCIYVFVCVCVCLCISYTRSNMYLDILGKQTQANSEPIVTYGDFEMANNNLVPSLTAEDLQLYDETERNMNTY